MGLIVDDSSAVRMNLGEEALEGKNRELEASIRSARLTAERIESAVESIQDAIALFDDQDQLVLCNRPFRRLMGDALSGPIVGLSYEQVLDTWIDRIVFESDEERARYRSEHLARRRHESTQTLDLKMRDGRSLRVSDRRTADGGTVKTIWDLTDDVRQAREVAEAASKAKSEFLSSMSHELRTPLNAILGFAQLLSRDRKEPPSARQKERIDHILKGGAHLLRLMEDILDLARIEARGVSISTEPVDLVEVLDEVRKTLEPIAEERGIRLEMDELPATPQSVQVDRTRFIQILMNLGSNAIKYNRPEGLVTFTVSLPTKGVARVVVRDTGPGIPLEKQPQLFQPFQRAGQEMGPIEGRGLGLVIARQLAHLMHGDLGFRSSPGEGTEFWLDVPLPACEVRTSSPPSPASPGGDAFAADRPTRILYVEDNPANVRFMTELFGMLENVELLTAPTAELGIPMAVELKPDVVIVDLNLPGMSGLEALRALRAVAETKEIPVIALTAAAFSSDRARGLEAGFCRYLTKPVNVRELVSTLETLLRERRGCSSLASPVVNQPSPRAARLNLASTVNELRPSVARFVSAIVRAELERGGDGHVAQHVMVRLHGGLWRLIGSVGFDVLVARSLVLARKDHPSLAGTSVGRGGTLPGLEDAVRDADARERVAVAIVTHFVELLVTLIGEDLAMRLVRDIWPGLEEEKH